MLRRVHVPKLSPGRVELDSAGSRHLRDVLRVETGTTVEAFDDAGNSGRATVIQLHPVVIVQVDALDAAVESAIELTIAAAVPKGERADWMIEKLSEIGCARFIPLASERSVVLPEGRNKRERWMRIATESAKQSRRHGVMEIGELTPLEALLKSARGRVAHLSTDPDSLNLLKFLHENRPMMLTLLVGPEGGWSEREKLLFTDLAVLGTNLTPTVLRLETAAVVGAGVVMTALASNPRRES